MLSVAQKEAFLRSSLDCPLCRVRLDVTADGIRCPECATAFARRDGYVDLLHPRDPLHDVVEHDFSEQYAPAQTPYWKSLRAAMERFSSSLPVVFAGHLQRPTRCLDVGTSLVAGGRLKPHLQAYATTLSVYCVLDPDAGQLTCRDERLIMVRGIGERLPFADAAFDLVLLHASLDHCADYRAALVECRRVLAPGGLVSVILNNDGSWVKRLLPAAAARRRQAASRFHRAFFTPAGVRRELEALGFDVVRLRGLRYLLLPPVVLETMQRLLGRVTPHAIGAVDAIGTTVAPQLGGDFHLIARRGADRPPETDPA